MFLQMTLYTSRYMSKSARISKYDCGSDSQHVEISTLLLRCFCLNFELLKTSIKFRRTITVSFQQSTLLLLPIGFYFSLLYHLVPWFDKNTVSAFIKISYADIYGHALDNLITDRSLSLILFLLAMQFRQDPLPFSYGRNSFIYSNDPLNTALRKDKQCLLIH